jgi:hypothetical protein
MDRGQVTASFKKEYGSFPAAMRKATKDARTRGYHVTVDATAQDDRRNRGTYGHREGYLASCKPLRKKSKNYAECKLSTRGKKLLKEKS